MYSTTARRKKLQLPHTLEHFQRRRPPLIWRRGGAWPQRRRRRGWTTCTCTRYAAHSPGPITIELASCATRRPPRVQISWLLDRKHCTPRTPWYSACVAAVRRPGEVQARASRIGRARHDRGPSVHDARAIRAMPCCLAVAGCCQPCPHAARSGSRVPFLLARIG